MNASFRLHLEASGVPFYRQIIDQVLRAIAEGTLKPGTQLPTVRQAAVELSVNPNTVVRAYRELEIRGIVATQQGTGTFVTAHEADRSVPERRQQLETFVDDVLARAGAAGFALADVLGALRARQEEGRSSHDPHYDT